MTALANVELGLALLFDAAFLVLYASRSSWRTSPAGRLLLASNAVLFVLMSLRFWARVVGPLSDLFWVLGFAALDAVFAWFLWLVLRSHHHD